MSGVRAIIAGVVLLLAAGCTNGDDDPPQTLPSITPSETSAEPSPTPSDDPEPTPTATAESTPEPRDGMHEYSQAGVEAFTRYVIDVINYSYRTNDVELLKSISTNDCQFCANAIEGLTFIGNEGGRIEGGQLEPTDDVFDIIGPAEGFETSAGVRLVVTASRTTDADGEVRNTEVDREAYFIFAYAREGEKWNLAEVRNAPGR